MHVLPSGFQKIRYYGFLNNRMKYTNLKVIFKLQNGQRFKQRFAGMTMAELLKAVWKFDICLCPQCGHPAMRQLGRRYAPSSWCTGFLYVFRDLPMEGLRSMPKNNNRHQNHPDCALQTALICRFKLPGRDTIPIQSTAKVPRLGTIGKNHFQSSLSFA